MKWLITILKWSSTKKENIIKSTQYQYINYIFSTIYETKAHRKMERSSSKLTMKLRKRIWKSKLKEKKNKILAILYEEMRTFKTFIVMKLWFQLGIFAMVGSCTILFVSSKFCILFAFYDHFLGLCCVHWHVQMFLESI